MLMVLGSLRSLFWMAAQISAVESLAAAGA
jgi:hypothetical protein